MVDALDDAADTPGGDAEEIRAFRQVPSDELVHILHAALLPGAVRITEEGRDAEQSVFFVFDAVVEGHAPHSHTG